MRLGKSELIRRGVKSVEKGLSRQFIKDLIDSLYNILYAALPFQMLTAKDIEAGTAQEYDLIIKCREALTIDSIVLECDDGTLTGCSVEIDGTAITWTGDVTTFSISTTVTEIAAISGNSASVGDRIKIKTTTSYTGTPTMISVQLNYSI